MKKFVFILTLVFLFGFIPKQELCAQFRNNAEFDTNNYCIEYDWSQNYASLYGKNFANSAIVFDSARGVVAEAWFSMIISEKNIKQIVIRERQFLGNGNVCYCGLTFIGWDENDNETFFIRSQTISGKKMYNIFTSWPFDTSDN